MVMVKVGIYPKSATIYTSGDAIKPLPVQVDNISNHEIIALLSARGLKSFARPKFDKSVYDALYKKGLMKKNKSLSNDGKNFLVSYGKDKLRKALDTYNKTRERWDALQLNIY
jgi:hypothetical protein